jgi:hypothetical protein
VGPSLPWAATTLSVFCGLWVVCSLLLFLERGVFPIIRGILWPYPTTRFVITKLRKNSKLMDELNIIVLVAARPTHGSCLVRGKICLFNVLNSCSTL